MRIDKRKLFGTLLGTIAFAVMLLAVSYAYYTWKSTDTVVSITMDDPYFYCESGIESNITGLYPVTSYRDGGYQTFTVNNIGMSDTTFSLSMNITSISNALLSSEFKYKLYVDKTAGSNNCTTGDTDCVLAAEGDFSNFKVGMNTLAGSLSLPNNVRYTYYLFLYIDGTMQNNPAISNSNITFSLNVCEVVVFLDYQYGNTQTTFLKFGTPHAGVPLKYTGLPSSVTRNNTVITYNGNNGTPAKTSSTISYTFAGWYTAQNGGGSNVTSNTDLVSTTNHTLYANWTPSTTGGCDTLPTATRTGYTFTGWYSDSATTQKIGDAGASYCPPTSKTLYAGWKINPYTITVKAGNGISKVALSGWTNTGTATMSKSINYASTLDLSTITPTYKTGYSGVKYTLTSGAGTISGNTFTVGAGAATITLTATTLAAPAPSISPTNTTKIYGASSTTLTASQTTSYDSAVKIYYAFGNSTSSSGSYTYGSAATTTTSSVSATSHYGHKYYKVKAYATDGTLTSSTITWSSAATVTLTGTPITLDVNNCGTVSGTNPFYAKYNTANTYTGTINSTAATKPTFTVKTGYTFKGWYTATSGGSQVLTTAGALNGTAVSNYTSATAWTATAAKTLYAQCTINPYTITVKAGNGISKVALSGWTNTGTATMSKSINYASTLDLSTITPTYKTGYSGVKYTLTSGAGTISGNTFTVGAGAATITLTATTLAAPAPSISPTNTTKIYGASSTTLTASQTTSYDSAVKIYYAFGNSTSSSGSYTYGSVATTTTSSVSATSHYGSKYYKVKAYATDGILTSSTITWSSAATVTLTGTPITLNVNNCGTVSGTNPFYAKYNTASIYTGSTNTTAATKPTFTVNSGYTFNGWYTATSGGSKVLGTNGSLTGTAVSNYTSATAWTATADKTLYAQCTKNTYKIAYTLNGGTSNCTQPTTATYDATVNICNASKTAAITFSANSTGATISKTSATATFSFSGWTATGLNTSTAKYGTTTSPATAWNGTTKVTAQYFKNLTSTSGATVTLTANWGTSATVPAPTITCPTGYTCTWNTNSAGTGTSYNSGANISVTGAATYYVKKTAITHKIAYNYNGGTKGTYAPETATYDAAARISKPTKSIAVTYSANSTGCTLSSTSQNAALSFSGWSATGLNTSTAKYGTSTSSVSTSWSNGSTKVTAEYFKNLTATSGATVTLTANWGTSATATLPTWSCAAGYTCAFSKTATGSGTIAAGSSQTVTAAATFYAQKVGITYNIAYNYNGGSKGTYAPATATYDSAVNISNAVKSVTLTFNTNSTGCTISPTTASANFGFTGWTASNLSTGTAKYGTSSYSVNTSWTNQSTKVTAQYFKNLRNTSGSTVTLTANWSTSATATAPSCTCATGYECKYSKTTTGSGTISPGANITSSTASTYYAKKNTITYTATYKANGGGGTMSPTTWTVATNFTAKNSTFTNPSGKNFSHWRVYRPSDQKWYGCTSASSSNTCYSANTTLGWYSSSQLTRSGASFYVAKANWAGAGDAHPWNLEFHAQWVDVPVYTISYNYNGGVKGTYAPTTGTYDSTVNISNPSKSATVTFNTNSSGCTLSKTSATASFGFTGWTASNLTTGTAKYGTTSSNQTTSWSSGSTKVTAQYFKNLRDSSGTVTLTANWSTSATATTPTCTCAAGYTCKFDAKSTGSGTINANSNVTVSGGATYYAKKVGITYTATYKSNGGSGSMANTTWTYPTNATLRANTFTKSGKIFGGWMMKRDTDGLFYGCTTASTSNTCKSQNSTIGWYSSAQLTRSGASFYNIPDATEIVATVHTYNVELYARWNDPFTYNIKYTLNGGTSGSNAPTTATYDSVVTIDNPTKNYAIRFESNNTGATINSYNATSGNITFSGWTASNFYTGSAKYGTSSTNVNTAWSNGSTKVTAKYFKNLTKTSNATVTLTANWASTSASATLSTVTKSQRDCSWNTNSAGTGTSYASGAKVTLSSAATYYAICKVSTATVTAVTKTRIWPFKVPGYVWASDLSYVYYYTNTSVASYNSGGTMYHNNIKPNYTFGVTITSPTVYVEKTGGTLDYIKIGSGTWVKIWLQSGTAGLTTGQTGYAALTSATASATLGGKKHYLTYHWYDSTNTFKSISNASDSIMTSEPTLTPLNNEFESRIKQDATISKLRHLNGTTSKQIDWNSSTENRHRDSSFKNQSQNSNTENRHRDSKEKKLRM